MRFFFAFAIEFLSTPSARRATAVHIGSELCHDISIHALREEGDCASNHMGVIADIFLSTPSARRATAPARASKLAACISIHALREEGDLAHGRSASRLPYFYPRPPRGGRRTAYKYSCGSFPFLSTPSARRATCSSLTSRRSTTISIHALREEGDCSDTVHHRCCRYFYPRPPRGGRPSVLKTGPRPILYFYPRPPRGGRLTWEIVAAACISISIHALREEGDPRRLRRCLLPCHFYPRPPRGGRPPSGA